MNILLLLVITLVLALCVVGALVLLHRRREALDRPPRVASDTTIVDLRAREENGTTVAALEEEEEPPPSWRARLAHQPRWRIFLVVTLALVAMLGIGLLSVGYLLPRPAERFIVVVAPFDDGSDGRTGQNVAATLAREIDQASAGAIVTSVASQRPTSPEEALALAAALEADVLLWGVVEPGAVLDSPSLSPRLIYVPTGPYGPNGWDGYLGRFAMPRSYRLAREPVNGHATIVPLVLALHDYARGAPDLAFSILGQLLENYPALDRTLPHALRGNILWARTAYSGAADEYRRALVEPADEQALLTNNLGAILLDAGDPAALSAFAETVRLLDGHDLGELHANLGMLALREGRAGDALIELEQARGLLPAHTPLLLAYAAAARDSGQLEAAAGALADATRQRRAAVALAPPRYRAMVKQRIEALLSEERALLALARLVGAQGPLLWELEVSPPLPARELDGLHDQLGDSIAASERTVARWRQQATSDGAGSSGAGFVASGQAERARLHRDRQRFNQLVVETEQARLRQSRPRSGLGALFGVATRGLTHIAALEALLQRYPASLAISNALGRAHRLAGELDAAAEVFDQTIRLAPQAPEGYFGLGTVAQARADLPRAGELYTGALERNNAFFPARIALAAIAEAQGDLQTALAHRRVLFDQRPAPASAVELARTLRAAGPAYYPEAEQVLRPYSSSSAAAASELGQLYAAADRPEAALSAFQDALRLDPNAVPAALAVGNSYAAQGDYQAAERILSRAVQADPGNVAAHIALANLYQGPLNDVQRAEREYRRALELGVADPDTLVTIGDAAMTWGNAGLAREAYAAAAALRPASAADQLRLSRASLAAGQPAAAADAANAALALTADLGVAANIPVRAEAFTALGDAQRTSGEFAAATASYNQALQLNPALIPAQLGLGLVAVGQGNWGVATGYFQTAANLPGGQDDAVAQFWLGEALLRQGNYPDARLAYDRALALQPTFPAAYLGLAQLQRAQGDINGALQSIERAIQQQPRYAEALLFQGKLYQELGRNADARAAYDASISANGGIAESFYRRGMLALQAGEEERAIRDLQRAIQLQENFPEAHYWLGRAYYAQGRLERALSSFQRAVALNGNYIDALFFGGLVAEELGRTTEAINAYNTVIALAPDSYFASKARDQIRRLS